MASSVTGLCQDCVSGYRLPGEPKGQMITIQGLSSYFYSTSITTIPTTEEQKAVSSREKIAVVLFPDAFGLEVPNTKIIVDTLTERLPGVDGYVLDMFDGERAKNASLDACFRAVSIHLVIIQGNAPFSFETYRPHVTDRPGTKKTWAQTFSFYWLLICHLPGIYAARPAVINERAEKVRCFPPKTYLISLGSPDVTGSS